MPHVDGKTVKHSYHIIDSVTARTFFIIAVHFCSRGVFNFINLTSISVHDIKGSPQERAPLNTEILCPNDAAAVGHYV
jgi:hypothetical protein